MNKPKRVYPIYFKALVGIVTVLGLGMYLLTRSEKAKTEFSKANGPIVYFDSVYSNLPARNHGKYRYIIVEGTERVFQIFVGNDPGDFSPEFSRIDELAVGDTVDLYYDDNSYTSKQEVNSLTRFIDRREEPYFIQGAGTDKKLGYVILGLGATLLIVVIALKFRGKIR